MCVHLYVCVRERKRMGVFLSVCAHLRVEVVSECGKGGVVRVD
jgi:hypothetical protein